MFRILGDFSAINDPTISDMLPVKIIPLDQKLELPDYDTTSKLK